MNDSVKKAFEILQFLAAGPQRPNLGSISRNLKMSKSTVFRYLETLEQLGMVEKTDNQFGLGLAMFKLGNRVAVKQVLINQIDPFMRELCGELNETVNLGLLLRESVLYLHKIESRRSLQMRSEIGNELPLHCTALGKSILASLDSPRTNQLVKTMALKQYTDLTIIKKSGLLQEIAEVRRRGYSTDMEEFEIDLACIAVPLALPDFDKFCALSISASSHRLTQKNIPFIAAKLQKTSAAIAKALQASSQRFSF